MNEYITVGLYTLAGGILSLAIASLLLVKKVPSASIERYILPFAAGSLLAAAFLDLLKDGIAEASADTVLTFTLAGVVVFFIAEKFLRWFHHHHQHGVDPTAGLIITGDVIHNALDGVAIAAAFLVSVPAGITTAIAVAAHEIPHEIGTFGLLLHNGVTRARVLLYNLASGVGAVVVALATYAIGSADHLPVGVLIGVSAGFLLYIAMSDVIPELHEHPQSKRLFDPQPLLVIAGILAVALALQVAHAIAGGEV